MMTLVARFRVCLLAVMMVLVLSLKAQAAACAFKDSTSTIITASKQTLNLATNVIITPDYLTVPSLHRPWSGRNRKIPRRVLTLFGWWRYPFLSHLPKVANGHVICYFSRNK